jgi:hypothetical protein
MRQPLFRLALIAALFGCSSQKRDVPSAAPVKSSPVPRGSAPSTHDRWSGPTNVFSGDIPNTSGKFTIELPATFEQLEKPDSHVFELNDETGDNRIARLTITSMGAEVQHAQTYAEYKEKWLRSAKILHEEAGEADGLTWAVLDLDPDAPDVATAVFAQPAAGDDSQSSCLVDVPRSAINGDELPGWDAMKRACRSIQFSW